MTFYISTMGLTPSAPCWEVSMAQTFQIVLRAAPTCSSWLSAVMLPSAAMDLCYSTQVDTLLFQKNCVFRQLDITIELVETLTVCVSVSACVRDFPLQLLKILSKTVHFK